MVITGINERHGITYADPAHDAVFQVRQVFGQFGRFQVVEHERHLAAMLDGRVAHRNVADPVVGRQARDVRQRRQFFVVVLRQPFLPFLQCISFRKFQFNSH